MKAIIEKTCLSYTTELPVRIYDLNYGRHVGHPELLRLVHQARIHFFANYSLQEHDIGGLCLLVKTSSINFRNEAFCGDVLKFYISINEIKRASMEMVYEITKGNDAIHLATVKETSLFINNTTRQIFPIPQVIRTIKAMDYAQE